jgi:hypothetical protein
MPRSGVDAARVDARENRPMLSEAERAEHRALSERAYGRVADRPLSSDEVARLRVLEAASRRPAASAPPVLGEPVRNGGDLPERGPDPAIEPSPGQTSSSRHGPAATARPARAARRWLLPAVAAGCLLLGLAAGWVAGQASPPGAEGGPPELARPATDEDRMNASGLRIDPDSTRFVARLDGVDVYLARAVDSPSVCLVTVSPATGPSAGCGEWSPSVGGIAVGLSDDLTVALGPLGPGRPPGSAFALSETVFAIRR